MMALVESEWFCLAVLVAGTVLAVLHVIDGAAWVSLVTMLIAHKAISSSSTATPPPAASA
jgi:hypothetical protein